jgi:DNA uptake protein ComE-like DNA-binding protein
MARRPWLDPLARRLLIATGQLDGAGAGRPAMAGAAATEPTAAKSDEALEQELLALRLGQDPTLRLRDATEVRRAAALGWRLDVNRATAADWLRLPGCRAEQADLLLRLQAGGVQLSGPDDLQQLLGLDDQLLATWLPLLSFQWYGEPAAAAPAPLAVNRASAAELKRRLGLSPERCRRLLAERNRAPFRDLADLQQRLQLPAAQVERWIGQVRFDAAPVSPELPPTRRRHR